MSLELRLFGTPGVCLDGKELTGNLSGKAIAVLAYLALAAPGQVPRSRLAALLWPDKADDTAAYRLRHTLWEIRRALGQNGDEQESRWLSADDDHCRLDVSQVWVDVIVLSDAAAARPPDSTTLAAAVALYRGDLLDGLNLRDAPLFDEWLLIERERRQLAWLEALWRLAQLQQGASDDGGAEQTYRRLIAADPLRERSYRGLMGLFHRRGERAAALRVYEECARALSIEMGIKPSGATEHLRQMIGQAAPPAAAAEFDRAAELLRQGLHEEAWAACAAAEACIADAATLSQAALLRAEIALAQGRPAAAKDLIQAARQTLSGWLTQNIL